MVAAVGEQDVGRPPAEIVERIEQWLLEIRVRRRATPVQEDEQLAITTSPGRDDEDLVQIAVNELAVQREAHDRRAARAHIAAPPIAQPDPRRTGHEQREAEN